jgi:hypothetical protein
VIELRRNQLPNKTFRSKRIRLLLHRPTLGSVWELKWPGRIQEACFAVLSHDELMRLGLHEDLDRRIGTIAVFLSLVEEGVIDEAVDGGGGAGYDS